MEVEKLAWLKYHIHRFSMVCTRPNIAQAVDAESQYIAQVFERHYGFLILLWFCGFEVRQIYGCKFHMR